MIKKLLILLVLLILNLIPLPSSKAFAADTCVIEGPQAYPERSTKINFKVRNTGLSNSATYYAHVRISLGYGSALDRIENQAFQFDSSNEKSFEIDVRGDAMLEGNGKKVWIAVTSVADPHAEKNCGPTGIDIKPINSGNRCSLDITSGVDSDGKYWTTNSTIYFRARDFTNLDSSIGSSGRPFKVLVYKYDQAGNIISPGLNDSQLVTRNDFIQGRNDYSVVPLVPYKNQNRNTLDGGKYLVRLVDSGDFWSNTLCEADTRDITLAGSDDPGPISGGGSCQYCPYGSKYQANTNPPVCINQDGSTATAATTNCDPQYSCDPIFGCIEKISGNTDSFAPTRTPPCSVELVNGICPEIYTGLGVSLPTTVAGFTSSLLGIILSLAGGIALILIIASGYRIMASQGNPEPLQQAKEQLTAAIVGLLFVIFSLVFLEVIGVDILSLPGFE